VYRELLDQETTLTFVAVRPFGPFSTSNCTWSPSFRFLYRHRRWPCSEQRHLRRPALNESEAFGSVEPFHCSLFHGFSPFKGLFDYSVVSGTVCNSHNACHSMKNRNHGQTISTVAIQRVTRQQVIKPPSVLAPRNADINAQQPCTVLTPQV